MSEGDAVCKAEDAGALAHQHEACCWFLVCCGYNVGLPDVIRCSFRHSPDAQQLPRPIASTPHPRDSLTNCRQQSGLVELSQSAGPTRATLPPAHEAEPGAVRRCNFLTAQISQSI
ncbi:hypothetical protein L1887_48286 [Cichorium endivia]|nr:hypothetical protein L1887_48286 [Cichorium endivia]